MASPAVLRTDEARFAGLADFPFAPRYLSVTDARLGPLRMAAIDEGPRDAPVATTRTSGAIWVAVATSTRELSVTLTPSSRI